MKSLTLLFLCTSILVIGQPYPRQPDAAQLQLKLKKLNFLGSVLYVAAHPDDENTRMITSLANDRLAATAYLSMTRGDGGQNLIGPEIRDQLGLIRTQELLAARSIDGGQQFFTRANDFGFSKSADEAFAVWGKDIILSDVVTVFRAYQPDVIITRFPPDARAGHGHHTASAILAQEAFDVAAQPGHGSGAVWQAKRLYTNTGRWWNQSIHAGTPGVLTVDVGRYSTLLGKSFTEIAAQSSSQHKSQGWGTGAVRGEQLEFLEFIKGDSAKKDIFEGINTTWSRVNGGAAVQALVEQANREFTADNPAAIVPLLFKIRKAIAALPAGVWRDRKLAETEQLIQDCLGLYINATSTYFQGFPGQGVRSSVDIVNRSAGALTVERIASAELRWDTVFARKLESNVPVQIKCSGQIGAGSDYSDPYWLKEPHSTGTFVIPATHVGMPQNAPAVTFNITMRYADESWVIRRPLIYQWTDPVKGELWRPFEIVPPVFVNLSERVLIFADSKPKTVQVVAQSSGQKAMQGTLKLDVPAGWRVEPASVPFDVTASGGEFTGSFTVYPPTGESTGMVRAIAESGGKSYDRAIQRISYDHFPIQTLLPAATLKVVRLDLKRAGQTIGYIRGAGDEVPAALRTMGYSVVELKNDDVTASNLKGMDAVVLGVRALNTNPRIRYFMGALLDYVKTGGTLVVQYNTNGELETDAFAPFPLTLSRERVTEEDAVVTVLAPQNPLLTTPNVIRAKDFEGWVQERGLYFPKTWSSQYTPLLSMHDKGETAKEGSLLVARYGEGYYIYTGLSFFRELPEGVPGAYKLFANLVSAGKNPAARKNGKDKATGTK